MTGTVGATIGTDPTWQYALNAGGNQMKQSALKRESAYDDK
jgi:hypothetical protein